LGILGMVWYLGENEFLKGFPYREEKKFGLYSIFDLK
jgi:hypothetical protein